MLDIAWYTARDFLPFEIFDIVFPSASRDAFFHSIQSVALENSLIIMLSLSMLESINFRICMSAIRCRIVFAKDVDHECHLSSLDILIIHCSSSKLESNSSSGGSSAAKLAR